MNEWSIIVFAYLKLGKNIATVCFRIHRELNAEGPVDDAGMSSTQSADIAWGRGRQRSIFFLYL